MHLRLLVSDASAKVWVMVPQWQCRLVCSWEYSERVAIKMMLTSSSSAVQSLGSLAEPLQEAPVVLAGSMTAPCTSSTQASNAHAMSLPPMISHTCALAWLLSSW